MPGLAWGALVGLTGTLPIACLLLLWWASWSDWRRRRAVEVIRR